MIAACLLGGCAGEAGEERAQIYSDIDPQERIVLRGNDPFWTIAIAQDRLVYSAPDRPGDIVSKVKHFAGNGGLGFSGTLDGAEIHIALTPGNCEDGTGEAVYPFTVTINLAGALLQGCGYTDKKPMKKRGHRDDE